MIKPFSNSFVYEMSTDPYVFLYLDTAMTKPAFENTVAHKRYHIGMSSLESIYQKTLEGLSPRAMAASGGRGTRSATGCRSWWRSGGAGSV